MHDLPTKKELHNLPTKKELHDLPTKKELHDLPTKKELHDLPTKKELYVFFPNCIHPSCRKFPTSSQLLSAIEQKDYRSRLGRHERMLAIVLLLSESYWSSWEDVGRSSFDAHCCKNIFFCQNGRGTTININNCTLLSHTSNT